MAITKIKLKQLENSTTVGSIPSSDGSNILTYIPPAAANHLWGYEHGSTTTLPVLIGTNLSYDTGTNTLNASAGAGGYSDVQEEGAGFTNSNTNTKLNFVGSGLTASDAGAGVTNITVNSFLNTLATAGNVNLATVVTGTLPVANGGTGAITLTGLLQGNGTGAVTAITNSSTVGQVLRVTGTSTYAWGALDLADTDAITGDLPFANLAQGAALSVLGVTGGSIADNASIVAGTDNQVLRRSGTTVAFGSINLASTDAVTGVLAITNGGTGSATQNFVDLSNIQTIGGGKTFSQNVILNGTPSLSTHAVNKGYVDGLLNGISWKNSVDLATTGNITLSGEQSVDGTVTSTSRVLVRAQTAPAENGLYTSAAGAWTRTLDMDAWAEVPAAAVFVEGGSTLSDTAWVCTSNDGGSLNTTAITWVKFSSASGAIDGSGATNKVAYWSDLDTLTSTTNFHFESGQLCIGTATLETSNMLTTKGGGSGNTTFGYRHLNTSNARVFSVADNGDLVIGSSTNILNVKHDTIYNLAENITIAGATRVIMQSGGSSSTGSQLQIDSTRSLSSGETINAEFTGTFTDASGTATNSQIKISNSVVQTGGGTGITRGIWVVPTALTNAADYRGLEITATGHTAIRTTAGKVRFDLGSDATGDLLVRGSGGELTRLAAGSTAGHVLTSNGAGVAPSYQATAAATTVTRAYKTSSTASVITLNSGTDVTDKDGAGIVFSTSGLSADQIVVVLNGIVLSESGTVGRDYTLNTGTSILTLASALVSTDQLMIYKIV